MFDFTSFFEVGLFCDIACNLLIDQYFYWGSIMLLPVAFVMLFKEHNILCVCFMCGQSYCSKKKSTYMCGHSLICKKIKTLVLALLMLAFFQIYLALFERNILACVLFYIIQLVLYCCFSCLIVSVSFPKQI